MDLQTQSSLNLQVNKEDLIDILIDEQLTYLEAQKSVLAAQANELRDKYAKVSEGKKQAVRKKLLKLCPIPGATLENLQVVLGHPSATLQFKFDDFIVQYNNKIDTRLVLTQAELNLQNSINEELSSVNQKINTIDNDIYQLNNNNKRTKAKMLKNFLTKTDEGKSILNTLGQTSTAMLQIAAPKEVAKKKK